MASFQREQHSMTRVDISTGLVFDEFVAAFESAAPAFDPAPMKRILAWELGRRSCRRDEERPE